MNRPFNWIHHLLHFLAVILVVFLAFYVNEQARNWENKKERRLITKALIQDLDHDVKIYRDFHTPGISTASIA